MEHLNRVWHLNDFFAPGGGISQPIIFKSSNSRELLKLDRRRMLLGFDVLSVTTLIHWENLLHMYVVCDFEYEGILDARFFQDERPLYVRSCTTSPS